MNILDLNCLLDIDRYRNINTEARTAAEIYADPSGHKARIYAEFLRQCVRRIPTINFADYATGKVYAQTVKGRLTSWSRRDFELAVRDDNARAAFEAIAMPPVEKSPGALGDGAWLDPRQNITLGQWADRFDY